MNKVEKEKRAKIITVMLTVYGCSGDSLMIAGYVEFLKDIPVELLDAACKKLVLESEKRPLPATILTAAKQLLAKQNNEDVVPWEQAWKEITTQLHTEGFYGKPTFSRDEIRLVVERFGWRDLCFCNVKDLPIVRAQMRDMYNSICQRRHTESINEYIMGNKALIEHANVKMITGG